MTFYIISDAGQIVENYHSRPTDGQLQRLADEMELCLYVIEGEHTGLEAHPTIPAPDLAAEVKRLREALQMVQSRINEQGTGVVSFTGEEWVQIDHALDGGR